MSLDISLSAMAWTCVLDRNITHNLAPMAREAGLYEAMWRPDEIPIAKAGDLIPRLEAGLATLRGDPARFMKLNPSNGWGRYENLVEVAEALLAACRQYPNGVIEVSR